MSAIITLPVRETDGEVRLDRFLRRKFTTLTQGRIEQMIRKGQIRIDGTRAKKAGDRLAPGNDVIVPQEIVIPEKKDDGIIRTRVSAEDEKWVRDMVIHEATSRMTLWSNIRDETLDSCFLSFLLCPKKSLWLSRIVVVLVLEH